jgi:glycosyltransferase involved in cell wall biosynthesis
MAAVTFVLPGDARSGGVRVTVIMANALLERGHQVRIAIPRPERVKNYIEQWLRKRWRNAGWLWQFKGPVVRFKSLNDLTYEKEEIVFAVGTYAIPFVRALKKPVVKVRYNHGLPARPRKQDAAAWHGKMLTITVSHTVAETLQRLGVGPVWGVVPNGIDTNEYFMMPDVIRDGIGAVFNSHPNKAPEDLIAVLGELKKQTPSVPIRIFSEEKRPVGLDVVEYKRLPSVEKARQMYNQSMVWILTSRTEGLPGVVLEAMACGCVVVSSDNDGSREVIVHNLNGILVPCGDRSAFVRETVQLLKDPARQQTLRSAALETIKKYTWTRAVDSMEKFLRESPALALKDNNVTPAT